MSRVRGQCLGIDFCGNHQRRESVSALVQADLMKLGGLSHSPCPTRQRSCVEGLRRRTTKTRPSACSAASLCSTKWSRRIAAIGTFRRPARLFGSTGRPSAMSQDRSTWMMPAATSTSGPAQRQQLSSTKPGVERGRPYRPVSRGKRRNEACSLGRRRDSLSLSCEGWQSQQGGRIDAELAAGHRAPKDRSKGRQRVSDSAWVKPFG